ncbi:MAG TPA: hypothetical protein VNV66_05490 [Pilimelia sp.]|nr:hypothetical protein [Pilimelia sp.]
MRIRHAARVGAGALLALAMAAGCASKPDDPAATTTPTTAANPTAALAAAGAKVSEQSFRLTGTIGEAKLTGAVDPTAKVSQMTMDIPSGDAAGKIEMRAIGADIYVRMTFPDAPLPGFDGKKWFHVDSSKAGQGPWDKAAVDAVQLAKVLEGATDVQRTGPNEFKGTLDATKASATALQLDADDLKGMGEKAKSIPFTARVDDQGRLVNYRIEMPAAGAEPAEPIDLTLSDFGTTVEVAKPPASEVTRAPSIGG